MNNMKKCLVIVNREDEFIVNVWWNVNLPNNPSYDDIIEEWIENNYGSRTYKYYWLDDLENYEIGAVNAD